MLASDIGPSPRPDRSQEASFHSCSNKPRCNLWPEPHQKSFPKISPGGSETKDVLEGTLYRTMCKKGVAVKDATWLSAARYAMTSNWEAAYQQYVGSAPTVLGAKRARSRKPKQVTKH